MKAGIRKPEKGQAIRSSFLKLLKVSGYKKSHSFEWLLLC
jgi:hypothetical protein